MKRYFILMLSGVYLIAALTSCDSDNLGETYKMKSDEPVGLSLLWSTGYLKYTPNATEATIPVVRENASGELTVPLLLTYDKAVFNIPTSVTFKDGESQALIKFSLANAVLSHSYAIDIALDVDTASLVKFGKYNTTVNSAMVQKSVYGIKVAKVTLLKDYAWENVGQASLNSTWFGETKSVQVQKAADYDVYRVVSAYGSDYDMRIKVTGTAATVERQQVDLQNGPAYLYAEGTGTFANKVFHLTLDFKLYYPINVLYYQELGDVEIITLPKN